MEAGEITMADEISVEAGVHYSFAKPEHSGSYNYFLPFKYRWIYNGEKQGDTTVYCRDAKDFVKLIRHWNNQDPSWVYILV
jgi:hypothetical protein